MKRVEEIFKHFLSGKPTYVRVIDDEMEDLEKGMIALVDKMYIDTEFTNEPTMYRIDLRITPELQKLNKPLEKADFYDSKGVPCLTYLEYAKVKEGEDYTTFFYDCDTTACRPIFRLHEMSKWYKRYQESTWKNKSYVEYLEYQLNLRDNDAARKPGI